MAIEDRAKEFASLSAAYREEEDLVERINRLKTQRTALQAQIAALEQERSQKRALVRQLAQLLRDEIDAIGGPGPP